MRKLFFLGLVLLIIGIIGMIVNHDEVYTQSKYYENKSFSMTYENINISVNTGDVLLFTSDDNKTHIKTRDVKNKKVFNFKINDNTLNVINNEAIEDRRIFNYGFEQNNKPTIEIYIPKQAYNHVNIITNQSMIEGNQLNAKHITINSKAGSVNFNQLQAKDANIKVGAGEIDISKATVQDLDFNVTVGSLNIEKIKQDSNINGHVGTGEANLTFNKQPTNTTFDITSNNGDIEMNDIASNKSVIGKGEHLVKIGVGLGSISIGID